MMETVPVDMAEESAAAAFNKQSPLFDGLYAENTIVHFKRKRVREHIERFLPSKAQILELNAGTGDDAIYFASKGHLVHATDISTGMQRQLQEKVAEAQLQGQLTQEQCSFTALEMLSNQGPYDHIFSNFAGLNCTNKLDKVLDSFHWLLKPGGYATLVVLPKFCCWEFGLLFKGKFKTAFRRFAGKKGSRAHIEGEYFRCWYYNPSYIRRHLKNTFEVISLEGLCTIVPPSYIEHFAERHPKLYRFLERKEMKWKGRWPFSVMGDYYIITIKKKT